MVSKSQKRNLVTFYIRDDFKVEFERFLKVIEKDKRITALRYKKSFGLLSIAITQLILKYLDDQDITEEESNNEVTNETNKIMD